MPEQNSDLPRRLACIELPSFALQLLLRRPGQDLQVPWSVVNREDASGEVCAVNRAAWAAGVRPGMRVSAAMSLCSGLRTGVVPAEELTTVTAQLQEGLRTFSPYVQGHGRRPGVFWLDASGLNRLFGGARSWAIRLTLWLQQQGWRATIVVGFSRFATHAIACRGGGPWLLDSPADEARALGLVPLERLGLPLVQLELMRDLGLSTLGDLALMSGAEVRRRFGAEVLAIWQQATRSDEVPVQDDAPLPPVACRLDDLDERRPDVMRLLWLVEQQLDALLRALDDRGQHASALQITLHMDNRTTQDASVRMAQPTLSRAVILDLVRLRLEAVHLTSGVQAMHLQLDGTETLRQQAQLWNAAAGQGGGTIRRDLDAAARAMARIAAEFGSESVGVMEQHEGHLPEAQVRFKPVTHVHAPHPSREPTLSLVRRILAAPVSLPHRGGHEPDGWLVAGMDAGPVVYCAGPYVISGGWWQREVHRDYYYAETRRGDLLWIYYDRRQRAWFQHGVVH